MPPGEKVTRKLANGYSVTMQQPEGFKMRDFRLWAEAESRGDLATCYEYLAKVIVDWDWPLDPVDPNSYDELTVQEYRQINQAVSSYMQAEATAKN